MGNMNKLNLEIESLFDEGYTFDEVVRQIMEDHEVEYDVAEGFVMDVEEDRTIREEANYYADEDADEKETLSQMGMDVIEGVELDFDFE